jgi:biopolymer transport protein ExbD
MDVTMTPMIDVVFLLLIFFIWTASFRIVEQLLPSSLVSAAGSDAASDVDLEAVDLENVLIRIGWRDQRPSWQVNDQPAADLAAVRRTLDAVAAIRTDLPVVIDPDAEVPLGHVIDVYDASRLAGFDTIHFTASAEEPQAG